MNITKIRLIEELVYNILLEYSKRIGKPLDLPIPIMDIAEKLLLLKCDFEVLKNIKGGELTAITVPSKNWIILDDNQEIQRLRYSLAHEIYHWFVEEYSTHQLHSIDRSFVILREKDEILREQLAEYFAGSLLMPRGLFIRYLEEMKVYGQIEAKKLADIFLVPQTSTRIRINQIEEQVIMNIIDQEFDKRILKVFTLNNTSSSAIHTSKINIVRPPTKVFDNRFIRQIKHAAAEGIDTYYALNQEQLNCVDTLMEFDIGEGFVFYEGNFNQRAIQFSNLGDVCTLDLSSHDNFYAVQLNKISQPPSICEVGTYPRFINTTVSKNQLGLKELDNYVTSNTFVKKREDAKKYIRSCKQDGKKVVIVTGCFDLLTNTHIHFLQQAKSKGDVLVVGIEDDQRIKAFKGPYRPINTQSQRVEVLEALKCVNMVFVIHGRPNQEVKPFYTRLHKYLEADILAVSERDPYLDDRKEEIENAGGELAEIMIYPAGGKTTTLIQSIYKETILSDLFLLKKRNLYNWEKKHNPNKQLEFPI